MAHSLVVNASADSRDAATAADTLSVTEEVDAPPEHAPWTDDLIPRTPHRRRRCPRTGDSPALGAAQARTPGATGRVSCRWVPPPRKWDRLALARPACFT